MPQNYDDILDLPHHVSRTHAQMPLEDRAAQFSPFAALTGFGAVITETGRLTEEKIELDEYEQDALSRRLDCIRREQERHPQVRLVYFQADEKKSGGAYISRVGAVRKIDGCERCVLLTDGCKIPFDAIISCEELGEEPNAELSPWE